MIQQEQSEIYRNKNYQFCRNFARIRRNLPEFKIPTHPGRIRTHPGRIRDASGIGISSAGICIWPLDPLLEASSCARPAGHSPRSKAACLCPSLLRTTSVTIKSGKSFGTGVLNKCTLRYHLMCDLEIAKVLDSPNVLTVQCPEPIQRKTHFPES